jgi:predicted RNase H-like nuclease (RuvC/YqgF family)
MTTETTKNQENQVPDFEAKIKELEAKLAESASERERLQAKVNEANKHTKAAERAAAEAARKKAEDDGNYEQLYKSAMSEYEKVSNELKSEREGNARKEERNTALKIASTLATGHNVELLADHIERRLKFNDGGVKVTDINGNLTVSKLEDLANEFKTSERFSSLVVGNKASGGSASGGKSGGSAATMKRDQFNGMNPGDQRQFLKEGGKLVD